MDQQQVERRRIFSWALYDWGNSAYATTVMAGFFPIFFSQYWSDGADSVVTTARLGTIISISSLLVAMMSPTLGVIADLRSSKKLFCLLFTVVGAIACAWMGFIGAGEWQNAMIAYAVAMVGFYASSVFYDALLPSLATGKRMDFASSLGYAMGYLGGGVLFLVNVLMYLFPTTFGIPDGVTAIKISFVMVAIWWIFFSLPLARNVPEPKVATDHVPLRVLMPQSFKTLWKTVKKLMAQKNTLIFMVAYWLYIDGVYTVMTMAVDYGVALGFEAKDLITALLITQFVGFPCAYFFGTITGRFGSKKPILFCLLMYALTVIGAGFMSESWHFFALALIIGMFQGGVQSLSRSMFGRMIRVEESGEYFGLFNLVGRFAAILGPLIVAFGVQATGSSRWGLAGLLVLFLVGGGLLTLVKEPSQAAES